MRRPQNLGFRSFRDCATSYSFRWEYPSRCAGSYHIRVVNEPDPREPDPAAPTGSLLPRPSPQYRRQAWIEFQRALDPLARPKKLPPLPWDPHLGGVAEGERDLSG